MLRLPQQRERWNLDRRAVPLGTRERRFITRSAVRSSGRMISGRAASYGVRSTIGDQFVEVLMPGCFSRSVRGGADVRLLLNHNADFLLARTTNRTLTLDDSGEGLDFTADVAKTGPGDDVLKLIARRDLTGMSFAFQVRSADDEVWAETIDQESGRKMPLRAIKNLQLFDLSLTPFPQYMSTTVVADRDILDPDECECDPDSDLECECDPDDLDSIDALVRARALPATAGIELRSRMRQRYRPAEPHRIGSLSDAEMLERMRAQLALMRLECL